MKNRCWICKRTEDFYIKQRNNLLEKVETELQECCEFKEQIYEETKKKLGFTDEVKETVKNIKSEYLNMKITAVIENKDSFINLEPRLEILVNYYSKYYRNSRDIKTVADIQEKFFEEPIESRYSSELSANKRKEDSLLLKKEGLEKITTTFVGKTITPNFVDRKLKTCYSKLGFEFNRQILLCPICASLFEESANASFEIEQARIEEERQKYDDWDDDDWDDDDWDDEEY